MNSMYTNLKFLFLFCAMVLVPNACVQDDDFGIPPITCETSFGSPTMTMAEVLDFNTTGAPDQMPDNVIFTGYVVSSDQAGNFFNTISLQDELENPTASLQVELDRDDLYLLFPVGQQVVINASNLFIDNDRGVIKIGQTFESFGTIRVGRIPEPNVSSVVEPNCDVAGTPTALQFSSVLDALQPENLNKLITINNVQFANSELGSMYAEPDGNGNFETANRAIVDAFGQELTLRNSGFASFANQQLPEGSGSITGVLSAFDFDEQGNPDADEYQFFIRDTNDVNFEDARFDENRLGITVLRNLTEDETITEDRFVQGIVILSPNNEDNINNRNLVLQDETGGIIVRFDSDAHDLNEGDEVKISLMGLNTDSFGGAKQLEEVDRDEAGRIEVLGTAAVVTPEVVTIAQMQTGAYESRLVQIDNVQFNDDSQGATLAGDMTITDCLGELAVFTRTAATFSGDNVPTGNGSIVAVGAVFNGAQQLNLQNAMGYAGLTAARCAEPTPFFEEEFDAGLPATWVSFEVTGGPVWEAESFGGEGYMEASAFAGSGAPINMEEGWLISPSIDMDAQANEFMQVRLADAFSNGNPFAIYYSNDYSGAGDPTVATWTRIGEQEITGLPVNGGFFDNVYDQTAPIDVSAISGPTHFAFVYDSNNGTISTTIQLGTVALLGQ